MIKNSFKKQSIYILVLFFVVVGLRNLRRIYTASNIKMSNSLLLIAHPDDESMFFSPFLFFNSPLIMCLSKGNFDNKGKVREKEIKNLCNSRGWNLKCLDYKDGESWDEEAIMRDVIFMSVFNNIENIITFDERGVSGHKNHISCYKAMNKLCKYVEYINKHTQIAPEHDEIMNVMKSLNFHHLKSTNIIEKYFISFRKPSYTIPLYSIFGIQNMLHHRSQLLWFRYIYIMICSYMRFNEFNFSQRM